MTAEKSLLAAGLMGRSPCPILSHCAQAPAWVGSSDQGSSNKDHELAPYLLTTHGTVSSASHLSIVIRKMREGAWVIPEFSNCSSFLGFQAEGLMAAV